MTIEIHCCCGASMKIDSAEQEWPTANRSVDRFMEAHADCVLYEQEAQR